MRLIDPAIVGETFEQLQQVRGFYTFETPLDVDRYKVGNETRDAVVSVREVNLDGVPADQRNWNNDHTVYTHGHGIVAAYGNRRTSEGSPEWLQGGIPSQGELGKYEPRIYFGEIVAALLDRRSAKGQRAGRARRARRHRRRADHQHLPGRRAACRSGRSSTGCSTPRSIQDFNILLNQSRINPASKILYDRHPRERVQKVAPWLDLDSDPYPAVVDGRVKWIIDGYTMSDNYPMSQRLLLDDATSTSLTPQPAIVGQPSERLNYVRNSVKATVDAYDGSVSLYAWDENRPDPANVDEGVPRHGPAEVEDAAARCSTTCVIPRT